MEDLEQLLENYPVVLVINDFSPFCLEVREIFRRYNAVKSARVVIVSSSAAAGNEIEKAAARRSRQRAAPYLFVNGTFIGGSEEIMGMNDNGELEEILVEAGALRAPDLTELKGFISKYPVVLLSNSFSPFCLKVQSIFEFYNIPDEYICEIHIDKVQSGKKLQEAARYLTKHRELPYAFIGGKFVGPFEDIQALHESVDLELLLVQAKALTEPNYELFEKLINSKPVVLIGRSFSPFCLSARYLLEQYPIKKNLNIIYVDMLREGAEVIKAARCSTESKALPYIFVQGKYLGKYEELEELHKADKLEDIFMENRALECADLSALENLMKEHEMLPLTNSFSPFCLETQHLLENNYRLDHSKLRIIQVDKVADGSSLERAAQYLTKQRQLPYLFVNRRHVKGDRNSLAKMHESGELESILKNVLVQ